MLANYILHWIKKKYVAKFTVDEVGGLSNI